MNSITAVQRTTPNASKKQTAQTKTTKYPQTSNGIFNLFLFISYMTSINHLILQNVTQRKDVAQKLSQNSILIMKAQSLSAQQPAFQEFLVAGCAAARATDAVGAVYKYNFRVSGVERRVRQSN